MYTYIIYVLPGIRYAVRTSQRVCTHSYIQVNLVPLHTSTYPIHSYIYSNEEPHLSVSNGRLCAGVCEKIPRTFAHSVPLFNKIVISSLVCIGVCALRPVPRTPPTPSRFRPCWRLWRPLFCTSIDLCSRLASKALSSWSLVVICALLARGKFKPELEFQAGTSSYHVLSMYDNIGYVEVPEDHLFNTYGYMNAYVPFVTYVWRTW